MSRANGFAMTYAAPYGAWRSIDIAGYKYGAPAELTIGERILRKACSGHCIVLVPASLAKNNYGLLRASLRRRERRVP